MVFQYGLDKVRSFLYDFNNGKLWMYIIISGENIIDGEKQSFSSENNAPNWYSAESFF